MTKHNHYFVDVSAFDSVDVYRMIELIGITCPVAQHVFKKAWATGRRGHKDLRRDWSDIGDSAKRKLQMLDEDAGWNEVSIMADGFGQRRTINPQSVEFSEEPAAAMQDDSPRMQVVGRYGEMAEHVYPAIDAARNAVNASLHQAQDKILVEAMVSGPSRPNHVCPACGLGHSLAQCNPMTPEEAVALGGKPLGDCDRCQGRFIPCDGACDEGAA